MNEIITRIILSRENSAIGNTVNWGEIAGEQDGEIGKIEGRRGRKGEKNKQVGRKKRRKTRRKIMKEKLGEEIMIDKMVMV